MPPTADAFDLPDAAGGPITIQFIDPDYGPFAGGTEVAIRGTGFTDQTDVKFGGRWVGPPDVQFIDSRRIVVRTPPGDPGLADVEVVRGIDSAVLDDGFTYEAVEVDPASGSVAGGTYVTLNGFGTTWDASTEVRFDGVPMTSPQVLSETRIIGFTPPGIAGSADVRVTTGAAVHEARRAFTYQATADPFFGGMGGGPINGTVNVVVIDSNTRDGVPDAFVALGDPATSPYRGRTDALGQITFSDPTLSGPVSLVAAKDDYETQVFVGFDAQDITVYMRQPPPPPDGPLPPAPQQGRIRGHIVFGDDIAIGSPTWDLVPEPRTPTERKRLYVTTTSPNMFSTSYAPEGWIDYVYDPSVTAWEFEVRARPSATAVVAIAGLYDSALDPSGQGVTGFEPFAMGVERGVLVGAGENVTGVDLVVDIPLDTALAVGLDAPPLLGSPGWEGPTEYTIRPFVDFGGEGMVHMNKNGLPVAPAPELPPNQYTYPESALSILLAGMAPITGNIADASYSFIVGAYSPGGGSPYSVRVARGYRDVTLPVEVGEFIPVVRPTDPAPFGLATAHHLTLEPEGASTGEATFNLHLLRDGDNNQLYRIFTRGDILQVDIPDVTAEGGRPLPTSEDVSWTTWRIRVPGATFDRFNYRMLSSLYWDAYMSDAFWVQFP